MSNNLLTSVPVLHVADARTAEAFYCQQLGFVKEWEYRPDENAANPAYMGLQRDGAWIHVSSFPGDGVSGTVVVFAVKDVDRLFAEFSRNGVKIDLEPYDQSWGNREMYLRDPDDNRLRFAQ